MLKHFFNMLTSNCGGIGNGIGNVTKNINNTVMPEPKLITPAIDFKHMTDNMRKSIYR